LTIYKNSFIGCLLLWIWHGLYDTYRQSGIARLLCRLSAWWGGVFSGSAIMTFFTREGTIPRAWHGSLSCRLLETVINLPAALLYWIYRKLRAVFENSFFALLAFSVGEQVPAFIGWVMLGILIIPYKHWNNWYSLIGFIVALFLFIVGGMRCRSLRLNATAVGPWTVLFAAAICMAWPLSVYSSLSFRFLFFHITCMLCVIVTVSAIEREEQLTRLVGFTTMALFLVSAYAMVQRIQGVEVNTSYVDLTVNAGMPGRVFSMFENPNAFAEILLLLLPLAAALLLGSRTLLGKLAALAAFGLGILAIGMTYSRSSWIGLLIAATVFVFFWNRRLIPVCILLAVVALPLLPETIFHRVLTIFNTSDSSTSSRFPLYKAALALIRERPVRGAGLGTDAVRKVVKDLNLYHGVAPFVHAHDVYLQVWLETGLVGVIAFIAAIFSGIKNAAKAVKLSSCSRQVRLITIGGAGAMAGIMVGGVADYIWNYPRVMVVFWFVFGVMLSGVKLAKKHAK
jgi:O-antigen ligase